jgi:transposase
MTTISRYYDITYKQSVVNYYIKYQTNISFGHVARQFNIKGGESTVRRWYNQRHSLKTKPRSGRPSILTKDQIDTYIKKKITEKNRSSEPIHYTQLLPIIKRATKKNPSLRTVQRYGKEKGGIKMKRTIKRTVDECNIIYI